MPSLSEALGAQQQQPSAQQYPAVAGPQDAQKLQQTLQMQQAVQQFPARLSQELDLASHVPPMPSGDQMAAARDAQWYAQVARTSPQWAAKLLAERDARRAAFQQFNQRLQQMFGGQSAPAGIPGINGQMVPNQSRAFPLQKPIIGVRG